MHNRIIIVGLLVLPSFASALANDQGIERVVLDDGRQRHCIDANEDRISVWLDRLVVDKSKSWLKEDTTVDIVVDGRMQKRDTNEQITSASSPVKFTANISEYAAGTVVVPSQIRFLSRFKLGRGNHITDLLELDFSFINRTDPTALSRVVSSLPDAAQGLPLPPTPYTEVFQQATETIGKMLGSFLTDEDNADDVSREGRISMEFNDTGLCGRNGTFAGSYLYIKFGEEIGSVAGTKLAISDIGKYCYFVQQGISAVYISRKNNSGVCSYQAGQYSRLTNPHFVMRIAIASQVTNQRETVESPMALAAAAAKTVVPLNFDQFTKSALAKRLGVETLAGMSDGTSMGSFSIENGSLTSSVSSDLAPTVSPIEAGYGTDIDFIVDTGRDSAILTGLARCADRGIEVSTCF